MTIQEATQHFHVSEKTIRRWIKTGKVSAELRDGRYLVSVTGHNDQTVDQTALVEQLRSEIDHLRAQVDHLTQLLAMQTKTTAALTEQLDAERQMIEDLRRRSWWKRIIRR